MDSLLRHAFMTGTATRVLRYMDRPLKINGAAQCETPVRELLDNVTLPLAKKSRRVRALDPAGKDRALLQAISDPELCLSGIVNKSFREKLKGKPGYGLTDKQLSAKASRQLRLLRDHGLIRKIGKQKKYAMTKKGRELTAAINALLAASTKQLMEIAA